MNYTPARGRLTLQDGHGVVVDVRVAAEDAWTAAAVLDAIGDLLGEQLEGRNGDGRPPLQVSVDQALRAPSSRSERS